MPKNTKNASSMIVYQTITESGANTLTFSQVQTGYGSLDKMAWRISRIEWYMPAATLNLISAADDVLQIGLVTSNLISSLSLADSQLIDLFQIEQIVWTGVGVSQQILPYIRDFSSLSGGGRLVLPYPLWIAIKGTSLATAATGAARIYFEEVALTDNEWMNLVQQTRLLT